MGRISLFYCRRWSKVRLDNRPDAFRVRTVDLGCGVDDGGLYKSDIDSMFKEETDELGKDCYICHSAATHRIIPKIDALDNEAVRKRGYVCENCLRLGYVNKEEYGIRKVEGTNGNSSMILV